MRVCIIVGEYDYGGISRIVTELALKLVGRANLMLLCRRLARNAPDDLSVTELKSRSILEYWKNLRHMEDRFDIIHVHDLYALPALVGSTRQSRLVFTDHGIIPISVAGALRIHRTAFAHICQKFSLSRTDAVVAISDYMYERVSPWVGRSLLRKIYNGIDLQGLRHNHIVAADLSHPKLLYVGRFSRHKGVYFLLHAFKRLLRQYPAATLALAGQEAWSMFERSNDSDNIRILAHSLGIDDKMTFYGTLSSDQDLAKRYMEATIVVVPSYWEGFGIPIIEAMALGRPVIARNAYAMKEHIRKSHGGVTFTSDDAEAFVRAFQNLMDKYDMFSKNAFSYASNFDSDTMANKHLDLYSELLG